MVSLVEKVPGSRHVSTVSVRINELKRDRNDHAGLLDI